MVDARDRLDDLLLRRATEGLDRGEAAELDALLAATPDVDAHGYDIAAAAVCLASLGNAQLPARLRARVERSAAAVLAARRTER